MDNSSQIEKTTSYNKRKDQALELGINIEEHLSLEELEKQIAKKLQEGIKQLKFIMEEIDN